MAPDGKPKMTMMYVEEPLSANVQYNQVPQQTSQQTGPTPVPNLYGGQTYSQQPKPTVSQQIYQLVEVITRVIIQAIKMVTRVEEGEEMEVQEVIDMEEM